MQPIECADAIWLSSQKYMNFGLKKRAQNADTLTTITSIILTQDSHVFYQESLMKSWQANYNN